MALFCESTTDGTCWSEPVPSELYNVNNSVHAIRWRDEDLVLWNDTEGRFRQNMTLGLLERHSPFEGFNIIRARKIEVVGKHGAYPSMCIGNDNNLHFTFTNAHKAIEYRTWSWKHFASRRRDPIRS
jgi:predicted neuraminidase